MRTLLLAYTTMKNTRVHSRSLTPTCPPSISSWWARRRGSRKSMSTKWAQDLTSLITRQPTTQVGSFPNRRGKFMKTKRMYPALVPIKSNTWRPERWRQRETTLLSSGRAATGFTLPIRKPPPQYICVNVAWTRCLQGGGAEKEEAEIHKSEKELLLIANSQAPVFRRDKRSAIFEGGRQVSVIWAVDVRRQIEGQKM